MNEPKRRGRPPKNEQQVREADVVYTMEPPKWGGQPEVVQMTPEDVASDIANGVRVILTVPETEPAVAQAYADRIWSGQSISLSRHERLGRIAAALEAQGLSMEGVNLP